MKKILLQSSPLRGFAMLAILAMLYCGNVLAQAMPQPAKDYEYIARPGDTMIGIARRLLIDGREWRVQRALIEHNRLKDADVIAPGEVVRIPENWMRNEAAVIEIIALTGDVQADGAPVRLRDTVAVGQELRTGGASSVTIKLSDASTLTLQSNSTMKVEQVSKTVLKPQPESVFSLIRGRVEAAVEKRNVAGARFEVRTPIAVAAVRGTRFRVSMDEAGRATSTEVTEGQVQFADVAALGSVPVPDGFGTRASEGRPPEPPRALLDAPRIWRGVRLIPRSAYPVTFLALRGAVNYRVRITRDRDSRDLVQELQINTPGLQISGLPDGTYFLRVRGVDSLGLEGRDSVGELLVQLEVPAAPPPLAPSAPPAPPATPISEPAAGSSPPSAPDAGAEPRR